MNLFNQIINAVNNPEQEANSGQLAGILNTVQQLSNSSQTNSESMKSAISIVGNFTRSALQQKRETQGEEGVQQIINQFGGTQASSAVLPMLFNSTQLQDMTQAVTNQTGINSQIVQSMLPTLVPLILNVLKTGNNFQNPLANNSVLNQFLDADGDGDVDIADAIQMASRYMNP